MASSIITPTAPTAPTVLIALTFLIVLASDTMTISIDLGTFSVSAILTAVKKGQVYADWTFVECRDGKGVLTFTEVRHCDTTEEQCVANFTRQLNDEQIREKLELDFKDVRDLLVKTALAPIADAKT